MPLREHFHPPLDRQRPWNILHAQWAGTIVTDLASRLPANYFAGPQVHHGRFEIDVGTLQFDGAGDPTAAVRNGAVATAVYAPPPTLAIELDWPEAADYEALVYDSDLGGELVAAIELVSPANKDRPNSRRAFAAKCEALLNRRVSVLIVDVVTSKNFNLYGELLDFLGWPDPTLALSPTYAVAARGGRVSESRGVLQSWFRPLVVGQPLPTLPLWLSEDFAIPLDLEASYEETCRVLRIDR